MSSRTSYLLSAALAALALMGGMSASSAQQVDISTLAKRTPKPAAPAPTVPAPILRSWMSPDIADAWTQGYKGQKVTMTFIDDFSSSSKFSGNFGTGNLVQRHGEWTRLEASLIAPLATIKTKNYTTTTAVSLSTGLNVLNLSYAMYAKSGYTANQIRWSSQENSIINFAKNGRAVVVKAAGNDGIAIGASNASGQTDYLNLALAGTPTTIYAGALNTNGTTTNQATMAWYSNTAGTNPAIQSKFLVVGVEGDKTGLYGTSFAAPILTGYTAILGSKFTSATPTQITNQLLATARKDTLLNYDVSVYGQGEASLGRALAPVSIR